MLNQFVVNISFKLHEMGYWIQSVPQIPGVQALLYAYSPSPFQLGFAQVEDHFLFVDWENAAFSRMDILLETFKRFSAFVNQGFKVPHAMRLRIPNLALVAVSLAEFPADSVQFVRTKYLNPWFGGETGQMILIDLKNRQLISHTAPRFRQQGSLPLHHSVEVIKQGCQMS